MRQFYALLLVFAAISFHVGAQNIVEYDFTIGDTTVNFSGKARKAIAINGHIPGPVLELTEGDTALIHVHNSLGVTASIHWHGILIPNQYDGVPSLTTYPIAPGGTLDVKFPVKQNGTYWYHSHTEYQEQAGLYGPILIHKRAESDMQQQVLMLSDWTDIKPSQVLRLLRRGTDWFEINKHAVQSYGAAAAKGYLGDRIKFDWKRMPSADISDVYYKTFLTNGQPQFDLSNAKPGERIRLRLINGSAATYFWMQFAGGDMEVVAADGQDVAPVKVNKLLIATAETYDVIITLPKDGKYELRATSQDVAGYSSTWIGNGTEHAATALPLPDYFVSMRQFNKMMYGKGMKGMKMGSSGPGMNMEIPKDTTMKMGMNKNDKPAMDHTNMKGMDMEQHDGRDVNDMDMTQHDNMDMKGMDMKGMNMMGKMQLYGFDYPPGDDTAKVLHYSMLIAKNNSTVGMPTGRVDRIIRLNATGNMIRYVWTFNNKTLTEADKLLIKKGEHVRVIFTNNTMMEHPLHLHGHFFRLLNGGKFDDAPLKHTFNLKPMSVDTVDFLADEEKDWFFHCHTLYHMMTGMSRIFHYANTLPDLQKNDPRLFRKFLQHHGNRYFFWGSADVQTQGVFGELAYSGTRWEADNEFKVSYHGYYESATRLKRYVDKRQFISVFVGADNRREEREKPEAGKDYEYTNVATAGVAWLLPMFVMAEGRIDHKGNLRLQIAKNDLPITRRTRLSISWNTDNEFETSLKYIVRRNIALSGSYDSEYGCGAGLSVIY